MGGASGAPAAATAAQNRTTFDIYVTDVEGGNGTLFVSPSGESVLIDTGNANGAVRDAGRIMDAVRDAGLTEVEPNSETVLVTWPIRRSEYPKILKRLQTLK